MWIAIGVIGLTITASIIYLACLDGNFVVKRSRDIDAPIDTVFAVITDFKSWPYWSPWLMHEPGADIFYSDNYQAEGGYYEWSGKVVGVGKMSHISFTPDTRINQQIDFIKPFKSTNQVNWYLENLPSGTKVSWAMIGKMPFLFRFMTKNMEPMIGRDYELGLALLSGYLNDLSGHPKISFHGNDTLEGFSYWGIGLNGNLRQLETSRKSSIDSLEAAANGLSGLPLTFHHKLDAAQVEYQVEFALPVATSTPQSSYSLRKFDGGRYFKMTLRGSYEFLPLSWYALQSHCRMHKIKLDPNRASLEIYRTDPAQVEYSNDITTDLYIAIK
ncbi:MAG: effector-binding domain-containing protein [Planctomycetota bacterium]|jgi:effector-binding domain-containing protein